MIANRAPKLRRHPRPDSATDVLDWATEPLAPAEIALIMQLDVDQTRKTLTDVGHFHPAGADGYWTLGEHHRRPRPGPL